MGYPSGHPAVSGRITLPARWSATHQTFLAPRTFRECIQHEATEADEKREPDTSGNVLLHDPLVSGSRWSLARLSRMSEPT